MHVHTKTDSTVSVRSLNNRERPPRRFSSGRLCGEPDCGTRLSVYNEKDYCSLHSVGVEPLVRGKRIVCPSSCVLHVPKALTSIEAEGHELSASEHSRRLNP